MSNWLRRALRLFGLFLFVFGCAAVVLMIKPGPAEVSDWMGASCAHRKHGPPEDCGTLDAIELLWGIGPLCVLVGGVMALALRPDHKGPLTLDFSRGRRQG